MYYGFGTYNAVDGVYIAVQHNFDLSKATGALGIYLSQKHVLDLTTGTTQEDPATLFTRYGDALAWKGKGAARELWLDLNNGFATTTWRKSDGTQNWAAIAPSTFNGKVAGPNKGGTLVEFFIPYTDIGIVAGDPLEAQFLFATGGTTRDLAPNAQSQVFVDDPTSAVYVTFTCDVSEKKIAIDSYGPINTPPPPKGTGIVYIAGNDPKLGMKTAWVPNKIALRDDGLQGDATANDQIWSIVIPLAKGTQLHYKYTIGLPSNEGQWSGTEEFPLTERALAVSIVPSVKKETVADIFADRPMQTDQQAPGTVVTVQ